MTTYPDWNLIAEEHGLALWQCEKGWTVTRIDRRAGQVYSVIPGDMPAGNGCWCARITDAGISYVSRPRSESYARKIFRKLTKEMEEIEI